ncbi:small ribosomal subunit protein mS29-like [Anopheles ziemanni]|uniref:small ribosomal subunit protein mS29-like n=1 Tax=Anopheles coustani TaxID=139045 RepID=UPI002658CFD7|nr:small ribosomal subunit protein mS29-like [Anopheles coustani]XP_058167565.1 small ribosomal subunit protein mS29-like [Anopheles ziemanni]
MIRSVYPGRVLYSTVTANSLMQKLDEFRTSEQNPVNHDRTALSRFYTVPVEVYRQIFAHRGVPKNFEKQVKTFNECCLMVRQPAVEIMEHLQRNDFDRPVNRFVLYGEDGAGKSLTLTHLLHYGYQQQYVLVHVPWVPNWMRRGLGTDNVRTIDGATDLPLVGAAWLVHFKRQNGPLLNRLGLTVSSDYVWSKRETTPAGSSLVGLVEHGIRRAKFASDIIAALLHELKLHSCSGQVKTMVMIDGFNAFFHPDTRIPFANPFLDITRNDWTNGVCVLTVDRLAQIEHWTSSCLPKSLLHREGFEHLDPFVPIRVDSYNEAEYESCIQYYLDRKWIQEHKPGFNEELKLLSCRNPFQLMRLCSSL